MDDRIGDDRVREHARTLVDWSARVEAGDDVVLSVGEGGHALGVAVAEAVGERGGNLVATYGSQELRRAYLRAHGGAFDPDPGFERELYERADVVLSIRAPRNTRTEADVPGPRRQAFDRARQGIREARLDTRWVTTVHPTRALAQAAGMSFEAYREFVYDAVLRDWEALAEEMGRLKVILDEGEAVRLVTDRTDLRARIDGRVAVNSCASVAYDSHNLPSGEVFTAPHGTEGEVVFDVPMTVRGRRVRDVRLVFEDGEVVDWSAAAGESAIEEVLTTDAGARRLGELGVGMNRGIDRVTGDVLFDEKMADTVHLALGRAYGANFPPGRADEANDSAVHVDLLVDTSGDARLLVDGETVRRDGRFRWEDGFAN